MTSKLVLDNLAGRTTAGRISVVGEGNSTTTNLQQGLCKAWLNLKGTDTFGANDSFNIASQTDSGTGNHEVTTTNAFATDDFSSTSSSQGDSSNDNRGACTDNTSTSGISVNTFVCSDGSAVDVDEVHVATHGDLA